MFGFPLKCELPNLQRRRPFEARVLPLALAVSLLLYVFVARQGSSLPPQARSNFSLLTAENGFLLTRNFSEKLDLQAETGDIR